MLNIEVTPPSLVTYGDRVMVIFSIRNTATITSAIYFYDFAYSATSPGLPVILESSLTSALAGSFASLTVDGNGDPHCVWTKKVSPNNFADVFYRVRTAGIWSPPLNQSPYRVSDQIPNYNDICPHIDDHGNNLAVVWSSDLPDDIFRKQKQIFRPRWFNVANYSQSAEIPSVYPVNTAYDFSVWCEKPGSDFDIRYRSDTYGFGWVSQQPEKEYFCHSQLQRDYTPWDLYTIFTKGNNAPYLITSIHQQFGIPPEGKSAFYTVETGEDAVSGFCIQRDSAIQYGNFCVDYGTTILIYDLCLLEPTYPFHELKGTVYFEGTGNKIHEIWLNGVKKLNLIVPANQRYDFEVLIPSGFYKSSHRITMTIKNPQNTGVFIGNLSVYRLVDGDYGGPQSSGDIGSEKTKYLILEPNPFTKTLTISIRPQLNSRSLLFLKIYNAVGLLIRKIDFKSSCPTTRITWDGSDNLGKKLPTGIYFVNLQTSDKSITEKVTLIR